MSIRSWRDFCKRVAKEGFVTLEHRRYEYKEYHQTTTPVNFIAAHPQKKLLLHAISNFQDNRELADAVELAGFVQNQNTDILKWQMALFINTGLGGTFGGKGDKLALRLQATDSSLETLFEALDRVSAHFTFTDWAGTIKYLNVIDNATRQRLDKNFDQRDAYWNEFVKNAPLWVRRFIL